LNALICVALPSSPMRQSLSGASLSDVLNTVFLSGNVLTGGLGKTAAFAILVPIGYLLIASAVILLGCRKFEYSFHVMCGALLLAVLGLAYYGIESTNLELLVIGLIGVVCGYMSSSQITRLTDHPFAALFVYGAYLLAITLWGVPFPLRVAGVFLTTMLIYLVGAKASDTGFLYGRMVLLGKYSLFGYISQIAILQILRRLMDDPQLEFGLMAISFVAGFALTMLSVEVMQWSRTKLPFIDKIYQAVFA
jgi:hypothetical protein